VSVVCVYIHVHESVSVYVQLYMLYVLHMHRVPSGANIKFCLIFLWIGPKCIFLYPLTIVIQWNPS
jgi:hypothetical protein